MPIPIQIRIRIRGIHSSAHLLSAAQLESLLWGSDDDDWNSSGLGVSNARERDTNRLDAACSAPDFPVCFCVPTDFTVWATDT